MSWPLALLLAVALLLPPAHAAEALVSVAIIGDGIPAPLTATPGDPARGRALVANRQQGLCLLCHTAPIPEERFQGDLAPSLTGTGERWSAAQLRLRMVDASRLNPDTIMPPYYRVTSLNRVAANFRDKPILSAEQIEDIIAYLVTLRN